MVDPLAFAWKRSPLRFVEWLNSWAELVRKTGGGYRQGIVFIVLSEYVRARGPREEGTDEEVEEVWRGAVHVHRAQAERDEPGLRGGREQGSGWREGWREEERAPRTAPCGRELVQEVGAQQFSRGHRSGPLWRALGSASGEVGKVYTAPTGTFAGSGSREAAHDGVGVGTAQTCLSLELCAGRKRLQ
ncbi:hypothetical protein B0H14DRAFT_3144523 [Mycena olivaceomarginata]|nr:hypothetical protein B0H14DRAFT_3144523 [Mycena olivaceomarginata]